MSRETEKFFRDFQKCIDTKELSEGELQQKLNEFLEQYNTQIFGEADEPDVYDYLEMAADAENAKDAEKYARMALELDPDCLDAEYFIASSSAKSSSECQPKLEALLKKGEARLSKNGITREKCAGEYYTIYETRPYIRLYRTYTELLIFEGKIRKAVEACKDILYLNHNDNLGVRYMLMSLYALLEEREPAEALYKTYPEEGACMLLPFIALYYSLEDTAEATKWLKAMAKHIKGIRKALKELNAMDDEQIYSIQEISYYSPFSVEELQIAYAECHYLYETLPDFIPWMISKLPAQSSRKKK